MIVLQILLAFCYMCLVPFFIGCLFTGTWKRLEAADYGQEYAGRWSVGQVCLTMASGLLVSYACYELLALAGIWCAGSFRMLSRLFLLLCLLLSLAGVWSLLRYYKKAEHIQKTPRNAGMSFGKKRDWFMAAAVLLVVIQIGAILLMATPDKDDAFYSGLSSMSLSYDYILEKDAYNGQMRKAIDLRYAVSALPVYQATLSLFTDGLHHLIITHNLFPLFYIPLAYGVMCQIGKRFLKKEGIENATGKFLLCLALLHLIGNYFVFSPENFLVTRIWQGKALFVAIGIPFLWYIAQQTFELTGAAEKKRAVQRKDMVCGWLLVAACLLACTFMGETGLYLGPFMLGCMTLAHTLVYKQWKVIPPAVLCCLPELLIFVLFLR